MKFTDGLSRLRMAYNAGQLVPFIGAGMSLPACSGWERFVERLEAEARSRTTTTAVADRSAPSGNRSSALIERADRAVRSLSNLGHQELVAACRQALIGELPDCAPAQTSALAQIHWPIVLSTNYDDWYARSARARPVVLGRSRSDCQAVLGRLEVGGPPILWALQGYLGEQSDRPHPYTSDDMASLEHQLVIGHHHYQAVMHSEEHFRRAFSDVFRRRSLLFLGSGLQEDYLLSLFGEILRHYGPNPRPHFAFLRASEAAQRAAFLLHRLNITIIEYDTHDDLPHLLKQLGDVLRAPRAFRAVGAPIQQRYLLDAQSGATLGITIGTLPLPSHGEGAVVSLGRREDDGALLAGNMAQSFLAEIIGPGPLTCDTWRKVPGTRFTYRLGERPIFGVAARETNDRRDLRLLAPATYELMAEAVRAGLLVLHVGLIAAGRGRDWHPNFSLIEMIRGVRLFVASHQPACPSLEIHIVDPRVVFSLQAGELPISELLSFAEMKFWVEIVNPDGARERVLTFREGNTTMSDVAQQLDIPAKGWTVETTPAPFSPATRLPIENARDQSLEEFGVVPGAVLRFASGDRRPSNASARTLP